jgi:ribosome-associated protein
MLPIRFEFEIPLSEISFSFVRSSGPGGQNVNKVNSKAVLRWNLVETSALPEPIKARILSRLADRLTRTGELIVASDRFRDQGRNREDCLEKLRAIIAQAAKPPLIRKATRPTRSSQRKKREEKKRNSQKKSLRRAPVDRD